MAFSSFDFLFLSIFLFASSLSAVKVTLDPRLEINWEVSSDRTEVIFTAIAQTKGYVGIGFSSNGAMTKADIVIGGVKDDGSTYFDDYHGPDEGNGAPLLDKKQDYTLIEAAENATHTTIKFSRKTDTCDSEDVQITDAGVRLIWALGTTDTISKHGANDRSVKSVYILDPPMPPIDLSHLKTFDITNTIPMPNVTTTYWCSMHRIPKDFPSTTQMIAYEPIFISNNSRKYLHHMNVLKCIHAPGTDVPAFDKWLDNPGVNCNQQTAAGFPGDFCLFLEYGWALGGELAVNPENVGFPFDAGQYYQLEVHLHNPENDVGEEVELGFKIYYTEEEQPIEGSLLMVSAPTNYQLMIPPNTSNFTAVAHCMPQCLNKNVISEEAAPQGLTAYNAFLHAHTSARKMRIRHYRGGKELPWIINDENYDFNYQTNRRLPNNVTILPGDQITAECIYDTHWKGGKSVIGGQSTDDEMCMVFIAYYPKIKNFVGCYDWMNKFNMYKILGVHNVSDPTGKDPYVTSPPKWAGKKFSQVVEEFEWTEESREQYKWQHQYGEHVTACLPRLNVVTGYYPMAEKYEVESTCPKIDDDEDVTPSIAVYLGPSIISVGILLICAIIYLDIVS